MAVCDLIELVEAHSSPRRYDHRMPRTSSDQTREMLLELLDAWDSKTGSVTLGNRESQLIGVTVYGLTAHTHELARAVLALDEADLVAGIVPLVRQAMECAMTAVWLELAGYPAVQTMLREQTRQERNLLKEFVKSGQLHDADAINHLEEELKHGLQSTSESGKKFEARCREIAGGGTIYAVYRALSATSHASTSVVDLYLEPTQDGDESVRVDENSRMGHLALRLDPKSDLRDQALGALLSMVVGAASAWSRLDRHHYMRTRLKEMCRDLNISFKKELTAHGLAQVTARRKEDRTWRREPATAPQDGAQ